jgi:lysophospholipase L1-like esterase
MKNNQRILTFLGASLLLGSCQTDLVEKDIKKGNADFTRYVAVGNSLTAGYADGGLSRKGQMHSYPVMLAEQFKLAGGGSFAVPYMNEGNGNDGSNNPARALGYVLPCNSNIPTLSPVYPLGGATAFNNVSAQGPYNLVGVPGARVIDANLNLYSFLNPFFSRFCLTPGVSTMISEAKRINATFFTLWLGSNDALLYATGGAVPPANAFSPSLTDTTTFRVAMAQVVDSLTSNGAKGAIANVPDVTSVPYFTTVPWNGVALTQGKADTLNAAYIGLGLSHIFWKAGANGFVISDSTAPGNVRQATANDHILLITPSDSLKCGQWGVSAAKPLADRYVLDQNEKAIIQQHISVYNSTIASIALAKGLALVDMNTYLKSFKSGIIYNGVSMNAAFITGGAFSLDGVHPNGRGYALIANEFIKAINAKFGSTIPYVDVTAHPGIIFP